MTFQRALAAATAAAVLALGGCTGGDEPLPPPPVEIPTLTPEPQPFRTGTSFADGVLGVEVPTPGGGTRTLDTVRNPEWTSALFLPRPVQPGHASREWILADNHHDGRVFLYALVSWDDADPSDYLAAGWWLVYPPDVPFRAFEAAARGVFLDGPELDPAAPPDLPVAGTASYVGGMGGLYAYNYGRAWGALAGTAEVTEFNGPVALTADFGQNRLAGCLGCLGPIETAPGRHLAPAVPWGRTIPPRCRPTTRCGSRPRSAPAGPSRTAPSPWPIPTAPSSPAPGRGGGSSRTCRTRPATRAAWSARPTCGSPRTTARTAASPASSTP